MFFLKKPSSTEVEQFISWQKDKPFSYLHQGISKNKDPLDYVMDHNRIMLGSGKETFLRAVKAIKNWEMFNFSWIKLCWPDAPIKQGTTVAVMAYHFGFWSLNAARIVYTFEEFGDIEKFGFAYGTLPVHAESGEERFSVEYHHKDNSVWYDLIAFSKPNYLLVKLGYPVCRMLQKEFAKESKQAMLFATKPDSQVF
ncbi:MAG: DUF1990 domain-containing protein [Acidobacteria bacterium]|nr:DUF1990 domain-containing protein [Acidobacteriota bacterium]